MSVLLFIYFFFLPGLTSYSEDDMPLFGVWPVFWQLNWIFAFILRKQQSQIYICV